MSRIGGRNDRHRGSRYHRRGNSPPLPARLAAAETPDGTKSSYSLKDAGTPDLREPEAELPSLKLDEGRARTSPQCHPVSLPSENSSTGTAVDRFASPEPSNPSSPNLTQVSATGGASNGSRRASALPTGRIPADRLTTASSTVSWRSSVETLPQTSRPGAGGGGSFGTADDDEEDDNIWVKGSDGKRVKVRFDPSSYLCVGRSDTLQPRNQRDIVPVDSDLKPEGWFMYHLSCADVTRIDGTDKRANVLLSALGGAAAYAPEMAGDMCGLTPPADSHQWQDIDGRKMQFFHLSHGDPGFELAEKIPEKHDDSLRPAIEEVLRKNRKAKLADSEFRFEITFGGLRSSPSAMVTHVQCAHLDHKTKVIEYYQKRDDKAAMLLFYPLTKAGMFLQVWVPNEFEPQLIFIGRHHLLVLPADTIHGGGFKSGSFAVQNHRRHGYVYVSGPRARIAREVEYSNLYIHPSKLTTPYHACLTNVPAETRSIVCKDLPHWFPARDTGQIESDSGARKRRENNHSSDVLSATGRSGRTGSDKKRR